MEHDWEIEVRLPGREPVVACVLVNNKTDDAVRALTPDDETLWRALVAAAKAFSETAGAAE